MLDDSFPWGLSGGEARPKLKLWWCEPCNWSGYQTSSGGELHPMWYPPGEEGDCVFCGEEECNIAGEAWEQDGRLRAWVVCLSCGTSNRARVGPAFVAGNVREEGPVSLRAATPGEAQMRVEGDRLRVRPGGILTGEALVRAGRSDQVFTPIAELFEVRNDGSRGHKHPLHSSRIASEQRVEAGAEAAIPFRLPIPGNFPVTHVQGGKIKGTTLVLDLWADGARPWLEAEKAVVEVEPTPPQQELIDLCGRYGLRPVESRSDGEDGFVLSFMKGLDKLSLWLSTASGDLTVELAGRTRRFVPLADQWRERLDHYLRTNSRLR